MCSSDLGVYIYAAAATDAYMNESTLTWASSVSGVVAGGSYAVTITPNGSTATAFRVYRSGLGSVATGSTAAETVRHVGDIIANGSSAVVFQDYNTNIPGSETIFLLDLDEQDDALDYRYLLPLSKIDLFAQSLYMPYAVVTIGAPRVRIARFHGMITNYVPNKTEFNPLSATN